MQIKHLIQLVTVTIMVFLVSGCTTSQNVPLANTKNLLPTEYNTVAISRVLYRSGESEYRINDVALLYANFLGNGAFEDFGNNHRCPGLDFQCICHAFFKRRSFNYLYSRAIEQGVQ